MIRLPVHFSDKLKSKDLEANFLVVDMPTAYNVILGRPTLHRPLIKKKERRGRKKKEHGKRGELHISCLIPCTLTLTLTLIKRRNKLHLLGVSTFVLDSLVLVYVVEVGLEIAILLKFLGQRHQDLAQISQCIGTTLLITLLLGLGHSFSPRGHFSLGLCQHSSSWRGSILISLQLFPALLAPGSQPLQPSALHRGSHPLSKHFSHCHHLLSDLGGIRGARGCRVPGLN
ncbi:hypothetical protein Cgig2_014484 [Carnegiea gigantea]|uniref:Uncharacterized protein n=1 Tax=Carnegiea gigantea TaxID=171969 RepID=A0A9Q1Q8J0_9CARY|nr:hypothetical protein Cgig2_014484 [Carnegiea gigantea]